METVMTIADKTYVECERQVRNETVRSPLTIVSMKLPATKQHDLLEYKQPKYSWGEKVSKLCWSYRFARKLPLVGGTLPGHRNWYTGLSSSRWFSCAATSMAVQDPIHRWDALKLYGGWTNQLYLADMWHKSTIGKNRWVPRKHRKWYSGLIPSITFDIFTV